MNSKWFKALNLSPKCIKLLEVNVQEMFLEIGPTNDFSDITPKTLMIIKNLQILTLSKLKIFVLYGTLLRKQKDNPYIMYVIIHFCSE